jgi:hypothetical protein
MSISAVFLFLEPVCRFPVPLHAYVSLENADIDFGGCWYTLEMQTASMGFCF